jgi:hypothetical protein
MIVFATSGVPILSSGGREMSSAMAEGGDGDKNKFVTIVNIVGYCFLICTVYSPLLFHQKNKCFFVSFI